MNLHSRPCVAGVRTTEQPPGTTNNFVRTGRAGDGGTTPPHEELVDAAASGDVEPEPGRCCRFEA